MYNQRLGVLSDIGDQALRDLLGTFCDGHLGLSIDGNTNDVETDHAGVIYIDGIGYELTAQAAIDISAAKGKDAGTYAPTVLATGKSRLYVLAVDSSLNVYVFEGADQTNADYASAAATATAAIAAGSGFWPEILVETAAGVQTKVCPIGAVHVHNATGSDFTFGTTGLDTASITDLYYDLCRVPG